MHRMCQMLNKTDEYYLYIYIYIYIYIYTAILVCQYDVYMYADQMSNIYIAVYLYMTVSIRRAR